WPLAGSAPFPRGARASPWRRAQGDPLEGLSAPAGPPDQALRAPTSLDAIFLVNVASYEQYWIQADPEAVELVVSAAADLVRHAAAEGRQVGLVTNGIDNLTHERPRSALARGPRSFTRSLEILARLGPYAVGAPETVF